MQLCPTRDDPAISKPVTLLERDAMTLYRANNAVLGLYQCSLAVALSACKDDALVQGSDGYDVLDNIV